MSFKRAAVLVLLALPTFASASESGQTRKIECRNESIGVNVVITTPSARREFGQYSGSFADLAGILPHVVTGVPTAVNHTCVLLDEHGRLLQGQIDTKTSVRCRISMTDQLGFWMNIASFNDPELQLFVITDRNDLGKNDTVKCK